jgi:hypothetical protein
LVLDVRKPVIASIAESGTNITMEVTNGVADEFFDVLGSSDASTPSDTWSVVEGDLKFDANGEAVVVHPAALSEEYFTILDKGAFEGVIFEFNVSDGTHPTLSDWDGVHNHPATGGDYFFNSQNAATETNGFNFIQRANGTLVFFHDAGETNDGPHRIQTAFTVKDGDGANNTFSVVSFNFFNDDIPGVGESKITGYSDGVANGTNGTVEWVVSGLSFADELVTNGAPVVTSGTLTNLIDLIVWETVNDDYNDDVFGSSIDNLRITELTAIFSPVVLWQDDDPAGPQSFLNNGLIVTPTNSPVGNSAIVGVLDQSGISNPPSLFANMTATNNPIPVPLSYEGKTATLSVDYYVPTNTVMSTGDALYLQIQWNAGGTGPFSAFATHPVPQGVWGTLTASGTVPAGVTNIAPLVIFTDGGFAPGNEDAAPGTTMYLDNAIFSVTE